MYMPRNRSSSPYKTVGGLPNHTDADVTVPIFGQDSRRLHQVKLRPGADLSNYIHTLPDGNTGLLYSAPAVLAKTIFDDPKFCIKWKLAVSPTDDAKRVIAEIDAQARLPDDLLTQPMLQPLGSNAGLELTRELKRYTFLIDERTNELMALDLERLVKVERFIPFLHRRLVFKFRTFPISIVDSKGVQTRVSVELTDSIQGVKRKIKSSIPENSRILRWGEVTGEPLKDWLHVDDYRITPDTVLYIDDNKNDRTFQIFVRSEGKTLTLFVHHDESVGDVKRQIEYKTGIPPEEQRLLLHGYLQLEDGFPISRYKIDREATLSLSGRLPAGMFHVTSARHDYAKLYKQANRTEIVWGEVEVSCQACDGREYNLSISQLLDADELKRQIANANTLLCTIDRDLTDSRHSSSSMRDEDAEDLDEFLRNPQSRTQLGGHVPRYIRGTSRRH
jgi:hypothetical protein